MQARLPIVSVLPRPNTHSFLECPYPSLLSQSFHHSYEYLLYANTPHTCLCAPTNKLLLNKSSPRLQKYDKIKILQVSMPTPPPPGSRPACDRDQPPEVPRMLPGLTQEWEDGHPFLFFSFPLSLASSQNNISRLNSHLCKF